MYLEKIQGPEDVKKLNVNEMQELAVEMRKALLTKLSKHGGHFGPNFGMVEATIAMHYVFDSPKDKIVYDVSHQSYPHKMLTGRKDAFLYEEHYDDVSGYSEPDESEHDHFIIGHTSTSVSLACGLAKGRDLCGGKENVIAVIGDGSLSGGEALEGLDYASELKSNLIIVINDNAQDGTDVSWLWDVDFDKLSDENLNTLTTTGIRLYDISLRFKYADVKVDNITRSMKEAIKRCLKTDAEVCYVLVNYTALFSTQTTMLEIQKELKTGGYENGK